MTKEKQYQIRLTLNISTIRALLKQINGRNRTGAEFNRCLRFYNKLEQKLGGIEIEHCEKKVPHHLS